MKKIFVIMSLLLITVALFGCGKTENSTNTGSTTTQQNLDKTGTLQGKIMDATTGAAISLGASGDQILLIQGASDRGPDKLHTDINDPLVGEYAFSGIPVQSVSADTSFKVIVIKTGYQRFEADITMLATLGAGGFIDNVINMIGNIYLFPLGTTAGNINVYVYSPDKLPISNATVVLNQDTNNNNTTANTGDVLAAAATNGLLTSLTATTNASGVATFSSAELVLGGKYTPKVLPLTFNGEQLQLKAGTQIIVGTSVMTQPITMTGTFGTLGLFATSATNDNPGPLASGVLTVNFNQAITLTTTGFWANGFTSAGTTTNILVQAALTNGNTTMTLSPLSFQTGTSVFGQTGVTYVPVTSPTNPAADPNATPFIITASQTNSGLQFNSGTSDLMSIATGVAVKNFVQQVQFP